MKIVLILLSCVMLLSACKAGNVNFGKTPEERTKYWFLDVARGAPLPSKYNKVTVCHAYGCNIQERYTFTDADILSVKWAMRNEDGTIAGERKALARTVAWIENKVGPSTNTAGDLAGYNGGQKPGQLDCVDEAANVTGFMILIQREGLLKHHFVMDPQLQNSFPIPFPTK